MDESPLPPLSDQIRNFMISIGRAARLVANGGNAVACPELRAIRMRQCVLCDKWNNGKCAVCGSKLKLKVSLATESCPKKKW